MIWTKNGQRYKLEDNGVLYTWHGDYDPGYPGYRRGPVQRGLRGWNADRIIRGYFYTPPEQI